MEDAKPSSWRIQYDGMHSKATVFIFQSNVVLCLQGRGRLTLQNANDTVASVQANGYALPVNEVVSFESPAWATQVTLTVQEGGTAADATSSAGDDANGQLASILIESINLESDSVPSFTVVDANNDASSAAKPLLIPPAWEATLSTLEQEYQHYCATLHNGNFVVVVAGSKGVGKSTFVRLLLHRLLCHHDVVALLDADVGQPEVGPPGVPTLSTVSGPLLGLPHHHMAQWWSPQQQQRHEAEQCPMLQAAYFYGSDTSQDDPPRYLGCVQSLYRHYENDISHQAIPLIINCDGWVKGLGLHTLQALVTSPPLPPRLHVVAVQGPTRSKQFDLTVEPPGILHTLASAVAAPATELSTSSLPSKALRELRHCYYFAECGGGGGDSGAQRAITDNAKSILTDAITIDNDGLHDATYALANWLASQPPYQVPRQAVQIVVSDAALDRDLTPETQRLATINGAIVGLCGPPTPADRIQHYFCYGLGIVRSIDVARSMLYILTPVPAAQLAQVTTLVRGASLEVPAVCLHRGPSSSTHAAYLSLVPTTPPATLSLPGALPMKSRNTLGRAGGGGAGSARTVAAAPPL